MNPDRLEHNTNAVTHGITANRILPSEDPAQYDAIKEAFLTRFQPIDRVEHYCVQTMVDSVWRQERTIVTETDLLTMSALCNAMDEDFALIPPPVSPARETALAFDYLSNKGNDLQLIIRYQAHLRRSFDRAFKTLQILQATRPSLNPGTTGPIPVSKQPEKSQPPKPQPQPNQPQTAKLQNDSPRRIKSHPIWLKLAQSAKKKRTLHAGQSIPIPML